MRSWPPSLKIRPEGSSPHYLLPEAWQASLTLASADILAQYQDKTGRLTGY